MARTNPPSPRTFLVRRIILLAVVVAVVWGLIALVSGAVHAVSNLFGHKAATTASAAGQANPTPGASASDSSAYTTCLGNSVSVTSVVGDGSSPLSSFVKNSNPRLWFTVTNTSQKPCYFNVGTSAQVFKVTSGSEVIWTNTQCKTATSDYRMLLQPGVANSSTPIVWARVHSSATGCDAASGQTAVSSGGASYHLQVTLNGVAGNDTQFILQ